MVVSADTLATRAGIEVLKQGGNAVDAAIAVGFALAVVYPNAGNIGGGGFMIIRDKNGKAEALDYREKAPLKASRDMYLDAQTGEVIEKASTLGWLASGVPGTVQGMWNAHQRYGSLKWKELLKPAIRLAEKGYKLSQKKAALLSRYKERFSLFPASKKIFLKNGNEAYQAGDLFVQKDLAQSLNRISEKGPAGFYKGKTASLIEAAFQKNGGLITRNDLNEYSSVWRKPLVFNYRGYEIYSMPPPSSGGVVMSEILNSLEIIDISRFSVNSEPYVRRWVEIERYAYRDRAELMGDTDFIDFPLPLLISKKYARRLVKSIDFSTAGKSDSLKSFGQLRRESEETTHFSVVDQWGNAVSNTYTLNGSFGSCAVVEGTGILMNNEMDDFSIKPGYPNKFGLVGNKANAIEAGKRMLSSMTPTIITKNGLLFMVVGSPGGSTIITTVAQVVSHVIDHKMSIADAVQMPRFHHQWLPDLIYFEKNFSNENIELLEKNGYHIKIRNKIGDVQAILIDEGGSLRGWSDKRGSGMAGGLK
jgi:gamma-glutamyltranspeptidase/glutathione hydrolase